MTHAEIINFYYGHRPDLTLKKLSDMTGFSISELAQILFDGEECATDETRSYGPRAAT
jgi:hypothetical protein